MSSPEEIPSKKEKVEEFLSLERGPQFKELRSMIHEPFVSYHALHSRLEKSGRFNGALQHVETLYASRLSDAEFLTKDDWDMLTAIWIYDPETADHSVETYRIAQERIDQPFELKEHSITINLSDEFSREMVNKDQFLRACLLHDVGKLAMPIEVLTNHTPDSECAEILCANYDTLGRKVREILSYTPRQALPSSADDLLQALNRVSVRPQSLVPVRLLLSSDTERASVALDLQHLGLTLDDSLITIMRRHDEYSRSILTEEDLPIEAELAGAHHRHAKEYSSTPHTITIGTLQVSVDLADIIHLADVTQAMESRRYYKKSGTEIEVLATLVNHASHGLVDPFVTYLWVADRWYRLDHSHDVSDVHSRAITQFLAINHGVYEAELMSRVTPDRPIHTPILH